MATTVTTHLMFDGAAEEAMNFYVSLFPSSEITRIERYGASEGSEGKVKVATVILSGRTFMCIDTPVKHNFTFTPAISLFVDFDSQAALDDVFHQLSTR